MMMSIQQVEFVAKWTLQKKVKCEKHPLKSKRKKNTKINIIMTLTDDFYDDYCLVVVVFYKTMV